MNRDGIIDSVEKYEVIWNGGNLPPGTDSCFSFGMVAATVWSEIYVTLTTFPALESSTSWT